MYFWKTQSLANDIKNQQVNKNQWKNYYLAMAVLTTTFAYLASLTPRESMTFAFIEGLLSVAILIFGINAAFNSNKGEDGCDFVQRCAALSLPLTIKMFLLSILIGLAAGILAEMASLTQMAMDWLRLISVIVLQAYFFWRLNVHIKFINADSSAIGG